jgi:hypothetical protein
MGNTTSNKVDKSTNTDSDTVENVYVNKKDKGKEDKGKEDKGKEDKGKEDKGKEDKGKVIIEFQPYRYLLSSPPKWTVYYKHENDVKWEIITLTHTQLKQFIETYGLYADDDDLLYDIGININHGRHIMS